MSSSVCRDCGAAVLCVLVNSRRVLRLNPTPDPTGNVELYDDANLCRVYTKGDILLWLAELSDEESGAVRGTLYRPHSETCPKTAHRRRFGKPFVPQDRSPPHG